MPRRVFWPPVAALALLLGAAAVAEEVPARRIVTLAPHLAELVYDAGAGEALVGVIAYSDHPPIARELPVIGDAFGVNREALVALAPDLILAWRDFTPEARIARLRNDGHRVVVLATETPEEVADDLLAIARLAGTTAAAAEPAAAYRATLADLRGRYGAARPVRVFVQLSARPLYTVNDRQMIGHLVRLCGGVNVFGAETGLTPVVGPEAVLARSPEVMLSTGPADGLAEWRRFPELPAVAAGHLYGMTADWVTRPSLRLARGAAEVCALIDQAR